MLVHVTAKASGKAGPHQGAAPRAGLQPPLTTGKADGDDGSGGRAWQVPPGHDFSRVSVGVPRPSTGAGRPLDRVLRGRMERDFNADFSDVRIHEGPDPFSIGAVAYTRGSDIHMGQGVYRPSSLVGTRVLRHELAHVLQQRAGHVRAQRNGLNADPVTDAEAERIAVGTEQGDALSLPGAAGGRGAAAPVAQPLPWWLPATAMGAVGAGLGYGATSGAAGLVGSALMGAGTLGAGLLAAGPLAAGLAGAGATYAGLRLHHALTAGGPSEAYNRKKHYGSTPTKADRKHFGATPAQVVDHGPPLVQRYYESARPVLNAIYPWAWKPGYEQSQEERRASGTDRSAMQLQAKAASHQQGAEMSQYSKQMKKYHDL